MRYFKTISEFHEFRNLPKPQHPLMSVINVATVTHLHEEESITMALDFYSIAIKRMANVNFKYGQQTFDFNEGIMSFMSPNQIFSIAVDKLREQLKSYE